MYVGGTSNYVNSLSNLYRYDYTKLNPQFNNTPINYGGSAGSQQSGYVNSDAVKYLQSIKDNAKSLKSSLATMNQSATFHKMTVASSSKEHLAIQASSEPTKGFQDTKVEIGQLAAGQRNLGASMKSADAYQGETGLQQFEIEVDGKRQQYTVRVDKGDTNRQVQQKMSDAINAKGGGIRAQVILNTKEGTTALSIQADGTGDDAKNRFTVTDRSGSLAASTGSANVVQQAQDAIYTVNGEEKTSKTNAVDLGNGVKATLRGATDGGESVTVSAAEDKAYAADRFKEMISTYNDMLAAAQSDTNGNTRLKNDLTTAMRSYSPSLAKLGVTMDADGKLSVDDKKLSKAAEDGSLERFFAQSGTGNYGFSNRLTTIVGNVERNPSYYVNNTRSTQTWELPDTGNSSSAADLQSTLLNSRNFNLKLYNQWYSLGYLFDLFV